MTDQTPEARAVAVAWKMLRPDGSLHCFWHTNPLSKESMAAGYTAQPLYEHPSPALKVAVEALKLVAAHDSVMARLEPDAHDAVRSALATIRAQEG